MIVSPNRTSCLIESLVELWDASVRASHHFLTDENIRNLTLFVRDALFEIDTLLVAYEHNHPIGFIGIEVLKIEMLFVSPDYFGKGFGKCLVKQAVEQYGVIYVDVNEQNPKALGFYNSLGFKGFDRTKVDGQGNPFPIIKMKLEFLDTQVK